MIEACDLANEVEEFRFRKKYYRNHVTEVDLDELFERLGRSLTDLQEQSEQCMVDEYNKGYTDGEMEANEIWDREHEAVLEKLSQAVFLIENGHTKDAISIIKSIDFI